MTAAVHMDSAAHGHGPSHSTSTSPPPWFPAGNHRLPRDFAAASAPTAAPPNHHHHRPARRVAKRRPRPSRKQPTTYITADPASFRRMVHQVTGADDLPAPHPETTLICRPAPYRAGSSATGPGGGMMLPTLDTSAFLLGATGAAARTAESAPAPPALERTTEAGRACCNYSSNSSSCGVFPTLDSWPDDALLL